MNIRLHSNWSCSHCLLLYLTPNADSSLHPVLHEHKVPEGYHPRGVYWMHVLGLVQ